ncbi:MAG TPA: HEPN domain-containing protein [Proteobacteria bacterium]|nr:HEPN domain-containing protein [Pseudomonadota bacterium]
MEATLENTKRIASDLVRHLSPVSVVLFGSVAKANVGNDVDLLIVTEDEPDNETRSLVSRSLKPYYENYSIDYLLASAQRVKELLRGGEPFLRVIQREGKTLYMKDFVEKWIQDAKEDYGSAVALLRLGYYKTACFHAHQSVEKHIKAQLLKEGWDLEKIHSIRRLINYARQYGISFDIKDEDISFLDSIYTGRYPASSGLLPYGDPTEEDAKRAVKIASSVTGYGNIA